MTHQELLDEISKIIVPSGIPASPTTQTAAKILIEAMKSDMAANVPCPACSHIHADGGTCTPAEFDIAQMTKNDIAHLEFLAIEDPMLRRKNQIQLYDGVVARLKAFGLVDQQKLSGGHSIRNITVFGVGGQPEVLIITKLGHEILKKVKAES